MNERVSRALGNARSCAGLPYAELVTGTLSPESARILSKSDRARRPVGQRALAPVSRRLAIGDPQAPMERFFAILEHNRMLDDEGWLRPDVYLLSMGDHFDWGASAEREQAAADGLNILAWLAAHRPEQVGLVLGNHDLGRIGELAGFDDDSFAAAHERAARAYRGGDVDAALETELLARYPFVPTAELLARDFAAFIGAQRELVQALLNAERLRVAVAVDETVLACHAGVTVDEMAVLGLGEGAYTDARRIADALQRALREALAARGTGPLLIPGLHRPGDRAFGEGGGMFYHRPTNPDTESRPELLKGRYRRRYDARRLPQGLTQIVGHIADGKCRKLLGPWASATPTPAGGLRYLRTNGVQVSYRPGLPTAIEYARGEALMLFTDGRMAHTSATDYQLLDLSRVSRE